MAMGHAEVILSDFYRFPNAKAWVKNALKRIPILFGIASFFFFFRGIPSGISAIKSDNPKLIETLVVLILCVFVWIDQVFLFLGILGDINRNFSYAERQIFRNKTNKIIDWYGGDVSGMSPRVRIPAHKIAWSSVEVQWNQIVMLLILTISGIFTFAVLKETHSQAYQASLFIFLSAISAFVMTTSSFVFDILLLNLTVKKMFLEVVNHFKYEGQQKILKIKYPVEVDDLMPGARATGRNPFVYFYNGTGPVWLFYFAPHSLCVYYGSTFDFRTGEFNIVHNLHEIGYEHITDVMVVDRPTHECSGFCIRTPSGVLINLPTTSIFVKLRAWALAAKIRRKTKELNLATKTPSYIEAEKFLLSLIDYEKQHGFVRSLEGFKEFLARLHNPERRLKRPIFIVGTKGKGSTAAHLAAALASLGYKVGLYTSPHLLRMTERIRIVKKQGNNLVFSEIPQDKFAYYVDYVKPYIHSQGMRTVFETLTAIAFLHFADEMVDFTVLEAGLGGRLDAINVVDQKITIVTPISYDHIHILGPDIKSITSEKLAVIKPFPNIKVIVLPQYGEKLEDVKDLAEAFRDTIEMLKRNGISTDALSILGEIDEKGQIYSPLADELGLSPRGAFKVEKLTKEATTFTFKFIPERITLESETKLIGRHQAMNAAAALLTLYEMKLPQFKEQTPSVKEVDPKKFPGRFHIIRKEDPQILVDGAHNPASIEKLVETLKELYPKNKIILVFGVNKDKEYNRMLPKFKELNLSKLILTRADTPRAEKPLRLRLAATKAGFSKEKILVYSKSEDAFAKAFELAEEWDMETEQSGNLEEKALIVVTGSFYLAGEMMKWNYEALAP